MPRVLLHSFDGRAYEFDSDELEAWRVPDDQVPAPDESLPDAPPVRADAGLPFPPPSARAPCGPATVIVEIRVH